MPQTTTRSTTDYKQFKFLIDNRQTARTHINKLKNAIQENPDILEVQPILVNEKLEIIDGQHRFVAASELGLPIHYNQVKGLNIATARDMNVLQRKWGIEDYAISYAKAGNEHYKVFNEMAREFPSIPKSIIQIVLSGGEAYGMAHDFRDGKFIVKRDIEEAKWIFGELTEIKEITNASLNKPFVSALMQSLEHDDFEYDDFKKNLVKKPEAFHRCVIVRDALRMIEDIHNYQKSVNLIRLY